MTTPLTDSEIKAIMERAEKISAAGMYASLGVSELIDNLPALCQDLLAAREVLRQFAEYEEPGDGHSMADMLRAARSILNQPDARQALDGNIYPSAKVIIGEGEP